MFNSASLKAFNTLTTTQESTLRNLGCNEECLKLIRTLPDQERFWLSDVDMRDILLRVQEIAEMTSDEEAEETLMTDFGFSSTLFGSGADRWIDADLAYSKLPKWLAKDYHSTGWCVGSEQGELLEWTKIFLLQEVRANLWLRFFEKKKKEPKKEVTKTYPFEHDYPGYY